jgi:starch-binding outer membrane protein, SusD/RagB family
MKKTIYILCISMLAFSCEAVFDVEPEASISDEGAITNLNSLNAALAGLYNQLQGNYLQGEYQIAAAVSSDVAQSVGTWDFYREMDTYVVSPDNVEVTDLWAAMYEAVNQANNIIEGVANVDDATQETLDFALGQAYFARGMAFFDLARLFGGVPNAYGELGIALPLEPSRAPQLYSRASLADTWSQIESDLTDALDLLPESGFPARASKPAARAMLARYHLYMQNYGQASTFAGQVIDDSNFELIDDVVSIFKVKNTAEAIFELQFDATDANSIRTWYIPGALGGRGDLAAHDEFFNSIPDNDERKQLFAFDESSMFWYPTKHETPANADNLQIIRLAEMYLTRAEADYLGGGGDPLADLNAVRVRAGLEPLDEISSLDDILDERKIEFCFEGHRWFDLTRTGKALDVLSSVPRSNSPGAPAMLNTPGRQVFPIPNAERNANPEMQQNPAYN